MTPVYFSYNVLNHPNFNPKQRLTQLIYGFSFTANIWLQFTFHIILVLPIAFLSALVLYHLVSSVEIKCLLSISF